MIAPRNQVKALIFGHTHTWNLRQDEGLHHVNMPATAYPFEAGERLGWVRLEPRNDGAAVELHAIGGDGNHELGKDRAELTWRPA